MGEWRGRGRELVVSSHYPPHAIGGAEVVAHRQSRLLQNLGWDVRVFAGRLHEPPADGVSILTRDRYEGLDVIRLHDVYKPPGTNFRSGANAALFADILEEFGPDVVHFHNVMNLGANLLPIAKRLANKVIVTLHDYWGFCFKSTILRNDGSECRDFEGCHACLRNIKTAEGRVPLRLRRDYVMECLDQADAFIAPSHGLAANYIRAGLDAARVHRISNGIDLGAIASRLRNPSTPVHFLLSCSYLAEHKGITQLVTALKLLWSKPDLRDHWRLSVAGDGQLVAFLRQQLADSGLTTAVTLLGKVARSELIAHLERADVVMLTSVWPENEPVSLLEGVASGAALIASGVGGTAAIVDHGINGLLYEATNRPRWRPRWNN